MEPGLTNMDMIKWILEGWKEELSNENEFNYANLTQEEKDMLEFQQECALERQMEDQQ